MSNVIQFDTPLYIPRNAVDVQKLQDLIMEHSSHTSPHPEDWYCWFLRGTIHIGARYVRIDLGHGLSYHTWRDFRYTLSRISEYILLPVNKIITVRDEFDGFRIPGQLEIALDHKWYRIG